MKFIFQDGVVEFARMKLTNVRVDRAKMVVYASTNKRRIHAPVFSVQCVII